MTTMAFHVSDLETDRLVRRLAKQRSLGITEAIKLAVCNELAKDGPIDEVTEIVTSDAEAELDRRLRAVTLDYTRLLAKRQGKPGVGSRIYQMLSRRGPVETLRRLVAHPTEGLAFLHSIDRLDLSAERVALDPRFESIVSEEVRADARANLGRISRNAK
jgi:hypothetical protein